MLEARLQQLETNIAQLKAMKAAVLSSDSFQKDLQQQWALRYGLFESVQIVIDISCHLVSKQNLGTQNSYRDCIDALEKFRYINSDLANAIRGMIGLRNILIHEYVRIDLNRLAAFLSDLSPFERFVQVMKDYVSNA